MNQSPKVAYSRDKGIAVLHKSIIGRRTQSLFLSFELNGAFLDYLTCGFVFRPVGSLVCLGTVVDYFTACATKEVLFDVADPTMPIESGYLD